MTFFKINDLDLFIDIVIKKCNKKIYIRPKKPNIVKITTPIRLAKSKIEEILNKNYEFIRSVLSAPDVTKENVLHLFGKKYNLNIISHFENKYEIINDTIYIYAKSLDEITIKSVINKFYKIELEKFVASELIDAKNKMNISFDILIKYKNVKSYFGQCMPKRRVVTFSTILAKYKPIYIISVIYHELAHFYYLNHNKDFYSLLESKMPGYKRLNKELKKIKFIDIY